MNTPRGAPGGRVSHSENFVFMSEQQSEVFSVANGEAYCWLEQESSVMLKAATKNGDPVELTRAEATKLAAALLQAAAGLSDDNMKAE
jgi:hypothetical protein